MTSLEIEILTKLDSRLKHFLILGWFDMDTMMTFPRLRSLTQNPNIVLTSLAKSPNDVLQASFLFIFWSKK